MSEAKPLAFDLLCQLESILESDPLIDEVGFIHPSQFVALSESSEIPSFQSSRTVGRSGDGIVESQVSEVNPSDMVFWNKDHKLAISTQALHSLYNAAKHAFMASLEQYKMQSNMYVKNDSHVNKNVSSCSSSSLVSLEGEVMKHSRALLLLSSDFGTAWNSRKDIVSKKQHFAAYVDELTLSELVLSYALKSEPAWSHRRWVIKMIARKCSNLQEIVENESELVKRLAEKSKMNYRAWNHRCWLVSFMPGGQVHHELIKYRDWAGLHVADNSCFHYRTRLMLRMLEDSWHKLDSNACAGYNAELHKLWKGDGTCSFLPIYQTAASNWAAAGKKGDTSSFNVNKKKGDAWTAKEELDWDAMLIRRYIGREALWLYRRFLSLCWIKHFAADGRRGIDLFMENELQLLRSCTAITDNVFDDYQSQAKFSATYFFWLMKQMPESPGVESRERLEQELEAILNEVCPEKAFLWDSLRTKVAESFNEASI